MCPEPALQRFSRFENEPNVSTDADTGEGEASGKFGNFVVYVDESGTRGMQTPDARNPVFVLAFCVFYRGHYSEMVAPVLHKFNHSGHGLVVLHEHEFGSNMEVSNCVPII